MTLPLINETLDFEFTVPSTGKVTKARPYLTEEEKILLFAAESGQPKAMFEAMVKMIGNCMPDVDTDNLTMFDVEYLFLKLRAASVGETTTVTINCQSCKEPVEEIKINLNEAEISTTVDLNPSMQLTPDMILELTYPRVKQIRESGLIDMLAGKEEVEYGVEDMFKFVRLCLKRLVQGDQQWKFEDQSEKEVDKFIGRFTKAQMQVIGEFLQTTPQTALDIEFDCPHCEANNKMNVRGVQNFFSSAPAMTRH